MKHTTVRLNFKGDSIDVDAGLAPFITKLWNLGITTQSCCQGSPGSFPGGYISVESKQDLYKLFEIYGGFRNLSKLVSEIFFYKDNPGIRFNDSQLIKLVAALP